MTNVTKIEIRNGTSEKVWYNGIESSATGADSRITFYEGAAITLETLAGLYSPYNAGAGSGFGAIWINGSATPLVDNTGEDYDLVADSPAKNWATWNSVASQSSNVSLTDANLRLGTVSGQNWSPGYLTFGPFEVGKPGKYYFEMNDDGATGYNTCNFGVTNTYQTSWSDFWWNTGDTLSWYRKWYCLSQWWIRICFRHCQCIWW